MSQTVWIIVIDYDFLTHELSWVDIKSKRTKFGPFTYYLTDFLEEAEEDEEESSDDDYETDLVDELKEAINISSDSDSEQPDSKKTKSDD